MVEILTTQENVDVSRAILEDALSQSSSLNDHSFIEVMARLQGMTKTEVFQFMLGEIKQNLARYADGDILFKMAENFGVTRKPSYQAILRVNIISENGFVPATSTWIGTSNGVRYFQNVPAYDDGAEVRVTIIAETVGVDGNLIPGSQVEYLSSVEGINQYGTVMSVVQLGTNEETEDEIRIRLLDRLQVVTGGSNAADYRIWGQDTPGVQRIYPYDGFEPYENSQPGFRTVYVMATQSYDPDGYADNDLIAEVRERLLRDPETGRKRPCLGSVDSLLYMKSIFRTLFYVTISGLNVSDADRESLESDILKTLERLKREIVPFVDGVDAPVFRNDILTSVSISKEIQEALQKYSAYATSVNFGLQPGNNLDSYILTPGEHVEFIPNYV